jgi:hypothetical protein
MTSPYYTSAELASGTGMCLRSILDHARKGWLKGTRPSIKIGWRFAAADVQTWADFYLRPVIKRRLLDHLDKPPGPKWCRSNWHESLHLIFDGSSPQGACTARLNRPSTKWYPASARDLSAREKCTACKSAEKHWQQNGHAP